MEQLTESRDSYDRNKFWKISAEVGQVCSYDQRVHTKAAKEVDIVHTDSRTDVCLLNLSWWLLAMLTAMIIKVQGIFTGGNTYYMYLQLWFSYVPCFQSVVILFVCCKWHPVLLGGYMSSTPLQRRWTWWPRWHWFIVLQQFAYAEHSDTFGYFPLLSLYYKLCLLQQARITSSVCTLKGWVNWNPGTVHISYGPGKLEVQ